MADATTDSGRALYQRYVVNVTPTVIITDTDGTELARLVGYDGDPDAFQQRLEQARQETPLAVWREKLEFDPDDLTLNAKIAQYYVERYAPQLAQPYVEVILENPEKAKRLEMTTEDGETVSAYEGAMFAETWQGVEEVMGFVALYPESPLLDRALSNLQRYLRNPTTRAETVEAYERLLKAWPSKPVLVAPILRYHASEMGDVEKGLEIARRAWQIDDDIFTSGMRANYADLLLKADDEEKALEVYGPSYVEQHLEGDDANVLNAYAWFWALRDTNLESALKAAKKAVELSPQDANIHDTLGMVYWKMGELEKAVEAQQEAVRLNPENQEMTDRLDSMRAEME